MIKSAQCGSIVDDNDGRSKGTYQREGSVQFTTNAHILGWTFMDADGVNSFGLKNKAFIIKPSIHFTQTSAELMNNAFQVLCFACQSQVLHVICNTSELSARWHSVTYTPP